MQKVGIFPPTFKMAIQKSPPKKQMHSTKANVDDCQFNQMAVKVAGVVLPWDDVSLLYFSQWLEKFSKVQGATKELMFMSILQAASSLPGLCKGKMTSTYTV